MTDRVQVLDTHMHGWQGITAVYLLDGPQPTVVDTGPGSSIEVLLAALEDAGVDSLAWVVLTHIHLDHAGAAGHLARRFPEAKVVVRQEGARHLADPSALWASASRIYPNMEQLWGQMLPIPPDRIVAVSGDGPAVDLGGGRVLEAVYAPGHAKHHMALFDSGSGDLFLGDALGVRVPDVGLVRPAAPPPEFDLELTIATAARLRALRPTRVFPTHYGAAPDVDQIFEEAPGRYRQWVEAAEKVVAAGGGLEEMVLDFERRREEFYPDLAPEMLAKFEYSCSYTLNAMGILRYLQRRSGQR
ncbi:MAG TPA: MBL fold metallo-hydrolase [Actinomycetota bacterium]|nr:MBL fold metallo-hydrolase [Actinomycetota bacterium]